MAMGDGPARSGLPRVAGHRAGVAALRRVVERAPDIGIARLTVYAFSCDNWRRPECEVRSIFWLLRVFLRLETEKMRQRGVCLQVIGRRDRLTVPVLRAIEDAERATVFGKGLELRVAVDYSSRDAISRAAAKAAQAEDGSALQESLRQIMSGDSGGVDLLIRTGGEKRLSDFLLWESAYAELYFTDVMWPDFGEVGLDAALEEFNRRERRFGAVSPETAERAMAATLR